MSTWKEGCAIAITAKFLGHGPLSDLLRVVRLDGAFFYAVEAAEPWIVESAPAQELKPQILPAAEHLISYHILTGGHCFVRLIGEDRSSSCRAT